MNNKTEKKGNLLRQYPFASACAGVGLLLAVGLGVRFGALSDVQAELDRVSTEGKRVESNVRNSTDLEEQVQTIKADVARIEALLRKVDDVSSNQEFFYRLESSTGVRLTVLRPLGAAKADANTVAYQRAGFNIVAEGSYVQLVGFLRALENSPSLFRLTDFSMQRSSASAASVDAGSTLVLNLNLQLLASKS
jgi:Tfp pilus assembly protein PilO